MPGFPAKLGNRDMFATLRKQDVLLHHPFQSFQPVIDFIKEGGARPGRAGHQADDLPRRHANSELVEALIRAAVSGKEVTVIVELMARFDEEANINWAERLEEAGAQVVYGVVGLKTHAKMALVLRREGGTLRSYAHLGTGNYNPTTARHYTDFGLMTADPAADQSDVNEVFIHLTSLTRPEGAGKPVAGAVHAAEAAWLQAIRKEAAIARSRQAGAHHRQDEFADR